MMELELDGWWSELHGSEFGRVARVRGNGVLGEMASAGL